ncbi:MAG: CoA transferase [Alphaproteobacteria bacterium]|jgi:crotonobetainyl-CoA:carnitine CoA-transferase CaiB-like acyl-CoA transferase|nr:CoA transferase [Alphaproteobacteria bacterium]MDP6236991.1 CoA transferase [Alphaproteobacteria bacterium]MDP7172047.1 CoA transferase [Alphaproteobacteria bacterium]MDP7234595.1 CoA transferase [Alphaproteobacteria bacterium]|tara:strand:+ start:13855 stop:15084 length:1230 start_codon:yes stop_codon:yes gene_type:complete
MADKKELTGPLHGFRVLDLTTMVSGPIATMMLADQGADVIKIEPPAGELMRRVGIDNRGMTSSFLSCNRSKRSLSVDVKTEDGLAVLKKLVATADVLVQNFRPGAIQRMGLGEDVVREIRPDIIYVSISGFGEDGPYAQQRVYDPVIQALSGLAEIQADHGTGEPRMVRTIIPDKTTSVTAAQAITAALLARERGGGGQHVRLAMLDTMVAYLWPEAMSALNFVGNEGDPKRSQMGLDLVFKTLDGYVTAGAVTDREWAGMCRAIKREELIEDERFISPAARFANITDRRRIMSEEIAKWQMKEILARFVAEQVPCAPILSREALLDNEQVQRNAIIEIHEDAVLGQVRQPRPAARFETTPAQVRAMAPFLGASNDELLSELGYAEDEIARLHETGVLQHSPPRERAPK